MAKYLDFTLCRGGALSPQDLVSPRQDLSEAFPKTRMDALQPIKPLPPTVHLAKLLQPI